MLNMVALPQWPFVHVKLFDALNQSKEVVKENNLAFELPISAVVYQIELSTLCYAIKLMVYFEIGLEQ